MADKPRKMVTVEMPAGSGNFFKMTEEEAKQYQATAEEEAPTPARARAATKARRTSKNKAAS